MKKRKSTVVSRKAYDKVRRELRELRRANNELYGVSVFDRRMLLCRLAIANKIVEAVGVFYDAHRDLVMKLEREGLVEEGGDYRENLPVILTAMANAYEASKTS